MEKLLIIIKKVLKGLIWFFLPFLIVSMLLSVAVFGLWLKSTAVSKKPHERFENLGVIVDLSESKYDGNCQPTVLLVSGSGGGFWGKYPGLKNHVKQLNNLGFHVMRVGYLKIEGLASSIERIEIESFTRVVKEFSKKYPEINPECVGIVGLSKGSELILNVASRTNQFKAVVAIVPPHVTFQGKEIGSEETATSSYQFAGKELPYVPLPSSSFLGIETIWSGELNLFNSGLKNNPSAVRAARIPVENITAPILLMSGKYDQIWPSYLMANEIVERLNQHKFAYEIQHIAVAGDHFFIEETDETAKKTWNLVIEFLKKHLSR